MLKLEKYLFHFLVLLALCLVMIPKYYITGDGASHTYNAKVLFDFVLGDHRDFYKEFYVINRSIDPNWMSHILLGFFLQIAPPWLADKMFQISYLLVFIYGFRYLIRSVYGANSFLSLLFFPFVFSLPFQQGFYNYCFALALLFWVIGYYLRVRHRFDNAVHQLVLSLLLLMTAFSHGMPAIYAMMMIGLIWLMDNYKYFIPFDIRRNAQALARLALVMLPAAFMILLFLAKRGTGTEPHAWSIWKKFIKFLQFWTSQSTRYEELYPALACGLLLFAYLGILAFTRIKVNVQRLMGVGIVFVIMLVFTFFSYLTCPHSIGGAGSIDIRLAYLPPLFLILFFATKNWSEVAKMIYMACAMIISVAFFVIRIPYVMKANKLGKEIMSAAPLIRDESVVLNLHLDDWQQLSKTDSLFHHDGSFIHFSDFIAAEKHVLFVMNYEAEINYFPVNWAPLKNPRESIPNMIPGEYPPHGDFRLYEQQLHRKVDYILLQNAQFPRAANAASKATLALIEATCTKIYESPHKAVILYKRN
ncbi:MAG TPA: hypothetical protein PLU10_02830 [Chitinophagaceae bacterium]|nr:hypothetical protein [Chitinophagaceae bacterium]